ncbi:hypothetical protein ACGFZ3_13605 [Stenotrophomonas sp. NPDC047960]|uniref:hypothetical protein n=1 Tax=Stenotrophomonas sp. NPDC047960 TaxID=3364531 RepID=UPI003711FB24
MSAHYDWSCRDDDSSRIDGAPVVARGLMAANPNRGDAAMFPIRLAVLSSLLLASTVNAAAPRYLTLLNRAHDSITTLEVATAGSGAFEQRPIDSVDGGGGSTTVRLGDAGCRFDLRLQFRNGRRAIYHGVNACKGDTLVIAPLR